MKGIFLDIGTNVRNFVRKIDRPLLIFLILILHVSLLVKLIGLVVIYALRPEIKTRLLPARYLWFYAGMAVLAAIHAVIYSGEKNYLILSCLVTGYWIAALLIGRQLWIATNKFDGSRIFSTLSAYYVINAVVTFGQLALIMFETGTINPYTYDGHGFKYSASTGDYLQGLSGDISTANMVINAFGMFYFMRHRNLALSIICFLVAVFTTSNLGNIFMIIVLLYTIISGRKIEKSLAICCLAFLGLFIIRISPSNLNYLNYKSMELLSLEEKPIKVEFEDRTEKDLLLEHYFNKYQQHGKAPSEKKVIEEALAKKEQQRLQMNLKADSLEEEKMSINKDRFLSYYLMHYTDTVHLADLKGTKGPGKLISFKQTVRSISGSADKLLIGHGGGRYSSKLAFKASGLNVMGRYVEKLIYVADPFKQDHLRLSLYYYLQASTEHSIINFPNSVFNQLAGEYGIAGLILFVGFYIAFFLRYRKKYTYGIQVLILCVCFLFVDYWIESFSMLIIFELLMLSEINNKQLPENGV